MNYLSNSELEDLSPQELIAYFKLIKLHKERILNDARMWSSTRKAIIEELKAKIAYMEDEIVLSELDREENDIAFNNTELTIN